MRGSRGEGTGGKKNRKNIGFLSNTGPYSQKIHKPANPAFNVMQSSAHQ